ncbi:MAG TPA: FG-GAP-like repeat-containing protein [Myxococcaceae bacterium]|nr:FG-GAP-like repeat-containing protein [Myxococcaceae bacterium]
MRLQLCAVAVLSLMLGGATGPGCNKTDDTPAPAPVPEVVNNDWVCSDGTIPDGRVVTAIVQDGRCGALSTYLLSQPRDGLDVCSVSPIPPPYVYVAINPSSNCHGANAYRLKLAADGLYICSTSPVPTGFVVDAIQTSTTCNGLNTNHLRIPTMGIPVCNISPIPDTYAPIPDGYVITNINSASNCGLGGKTYTLAPIFNGISACSISPIPREYVVTAASVSSRCATLNEFVLSLAYDGIVTCPFFDPPPNYTISGYRNVSNCVGFSPGYILHRSYSCSSPQVVCDSGCADKATDPANCGACGNACGSGATCSSGYCCASGLSWCQLAHACVDTGTCCSAPLANCDGNAVNGCETNLNTSPANCGACGAVCPARANAAATCSSGACNFSCNTGFANCNGSTTDGCEVNLGTDPNHCGACPMACPARTNATATCSSSACSFSCFTGFANCNGIATDGCEADLNGSTTNCGTCGHACTPPANASAICTSRVCGFACLPGYAQSGSICIGIDPPQPLAPLSTAKVTSQRPTLRWKLFGNEDGAHVQICRDRGCGQVEQTLDASGTSVQLTTSLPAGVHFWRLYGRVGTRIGILYGPTWEFFVGIRSAPVSTSWGTVADFNGDGYPDLAVGAFEVVVGGASEAGRVYVYYGSAAGLPATPSISLNGPDGAGAQYGCAVASIGDVNGDGFADLAVGSNGAAGLNGTPGAGRVHVYLGGPSGLLATPSQTILSPDSAAAHFGLAVSGGGDANGDGYADLLVGAPYAAVGSTSQVGRVHVFFGGASGVATTASQTYDGPDGTYGDFGSDVESIGDANGDGYSDLAIGADYASVNQVSASGRVRVYLGGLAGFAASPSVTIDSPDPRGRFGVLGSGGDLDGDGYADLVVGSFMSAVGTATGVGRVRVYRGGPGGVSTAPSAVLDGLDGADGNFGSSVANAGDVNGDGYDDLAVGAWDATVGTSTNAGKAYVFLGGPGGVAAAPSQTLSGPDGTSSRFGATVSTGEDYNHDGRCDITMGDYPGQGPGWVHIYGFQGSFTRSFSGPDGPGSFFGAALTR